MSAKSSKKPGVLPPPLLVVDTNIFVYGLFSPDRYRASAQLLEEEEAGRVRFVFSEETKAELVFIFAREGTKMPNVTVNSFYELNLGLAALWSRSKTVRLPGGLKQPIPGLRDKTDAMFAYTAVAGNAGYLLTYDAESGLLDMETYQGVTILKPEDFFKRVKLTG